MRAGILGALLEAMVTDVAGPCRAEPSRRGGSVGDGLVIEDVRFCARHGCGRGEAAAWFAVDVELELDVAPAALADSLDGAVDYEHVATRVVELGTGPRVNLLERLAVRIADGLLQTFPARQVHVRLRRLRAGANPGPDRPQLGTPAVRVTRSRR